jgi:hypothetical protein
MKRRGWLKAKTPSVRVYDACNHMTRKGFLTREGKLYKAVAGMKVNLVERDEAGV